MSKATMPLLLPGCDSGCKDWSRYPSTCQGFLGTHWVLVSPWVAPVLTVCPWALLLQGEGSAPRSFAFRAGVGLRHVPHATIVSLHDSTRISREVLQGWKRQGSCATPVALRAEGAKLQPDHSPHTPPDQEVCKGTRWRSEISKHVPYPTSPVSLILDTAQSPASLAAGDQRKQAPLQRRQGFFERTISTAMNDLLGLHLDTASLKPIPRLLKRPTRGEQGPPDFPAGEKVQACPYEQ